MLFVLCVCVHSSVRPCVRASVRLLDLALAISFPRSCFFPSFVWLSSLKLLSLVFPCLYSPHQILGMFLFLLLLARLNLGSRFTSLRYCSSLHDLSPSSPAIFKPRLEASARTRACFTEHADNIDHKRRSIHEKQKQRPAAIGGHRLGGGVGEVGIAR